MPVLEGKVAIVTGAGRGIGRALALRFAAEGAKVLVNDIDAAAAEAVAGEVRRRGSIAHADANTVTAMEGSAAIVRAVLSAFGRVDIVAAAAGIMSNRMIFKMTEQEWDSVIDVNLKGTFTVVHHASEVFREQKRGRIITFSSEAGITGGGAGQASYAAAKAGIIGLTRAVAREMERYGVTANCIVPRALTRMTVGLDKLREDSPGMSIPVLVEPDRSYADMDPDDVAKFAAFLASDAAQNISGRVFLVYADVIGLVATDRLVAIACKPGKWSVDELARFVPGTLLKMG